MASIRLHDVMVDFPIYRGSSRSLRRLLFTLGSAGGAAHDDGHQMCIRALEGISLEFQDGDRVGLVGINGAGKTTLLRVLAGVYEPTSGAVSSQGRIATLFELGLGINQEFTGRENIFLRGYYMGLTPAEVEANLAEIEEFTELGDYLSLPVRTYSAGMRLRLAFATATCVHPEILLMDEWLLAGDGPFLNKARLRLENYVTRSNIMVLASHKLELLRQWCNRLILLHRGRVEAIGTPDEVLALYRQLMARS